MKKLLTNKIFRIISIIVIVIIVMLLVFYIFLNPYRGTLKKYTETLPLDETITKEEAIEDIDYVMKLFRTRHPAWLEDKNSRVQNVEAQYVAEVNALNDSQVEEITVLDEWKIIGRIMHEMYDGHSCVYPRYADELYISDFSELNKYGTPVQINGEPTEDVFNRFLAVYQYEMESYARATFEEGNLFYKNRMEWADVDTSDGITYTFDTEEGLKDFHYDFVPFEQVVGYVAPKNDGEWVYYEISPDNNVGIFTLKDCAYNDEYKRTVKEFFQAVNEAEVENIIVDLRNNGGGNSLVADEFLNYLNIDGYYTWAEHDRYGNFLVKFNRRYKKVDNRTPKFAGDLYVLTCTHTFSSAMDFAMYITDNDLGEIIGEPAGNMPNSYGDVLNFVVPNSKLHINISYKKWFRIDESKADEPLNPDYPCDADDAMDKAFEIINSK